MLGLIAGNRRLTRLVTSWGARAVAVIAAALAMLSVVDNALQHSPDVLLVAAGTLLSVFAVLGPLALQIIPLTASLAACWLLRPTTRIAVAATVVVVYWLAHFLLSFPAGLRPPTWPTFLGLHITTDIYVIGLPWLIALLLPPPPPRDQ